MNRPQRLHHLFGRMEHRLQSLPLLLRLHRDVSFQTLNSDRLAALGTSTRLASSAVTMSFARMSRGAPRRALAASVGALPADCPASVVAVATVLGLPVFVSRSRPTTKAATLAVCALLMFSTKGDSRQNHDNLVDTAKKTTKHPCNSPREVSASSVAFVPKWLEPEWLRTVGGDDDDETFGKVLEHKASPETNETRTCCQNSNLTLDAWKTNWFQHGSFCTRTCGFKTAHVVKTNKPAQIIAGLS